MKSCETQSELFNTMPVRSYLSFCYDVLQRKGRSRSAERAPSPT